MMGALGNKEVFAKNLRALMERYGKDRMQVCEDLGFKYTTFTDWYNGKKYPRIDKIEMLARYFKVLKSDLIEDHDSSPDNGTESVPEYSSKPRTISRAELKFALWGDDEGISDEDLEDVRRYAAFVAERKKKK